MVRNRWITAGFVVLSAQFLTGCTKERPVTTGPESKMTRVNGTLNAFTCYGGGQGPFYEILDDSAVVVALLSGEVVARATTDRRSGFVMDLASGTYDFAVRHAYFFPPDTTYAVELIEGDTVLSLWTPFVTYDPVMLILSFHYDEVSDSLGIDGEWDVITDLNERTLAANSQSVAALDIEGTNPEDWERYASLPDISYYLPVNRFSPSGDTVYNVVEVCQILNGMIDPDGPGLEQPWLYAEPYSLIVCFDL